MKRAAALVGLSREHHTALSLAQRARRAAAEGGAAAAAMAATASSCFQTELKPHFDEEEAWLLPALERAGEAALVARTLADHAGLTALAGRLLAPGAEPGTLRAFADSLIEHVRFEERELFPAAERHPACLAGR